MCQMSYLNLDREVAHLERVFGRLSANDGLPLWYWENRLRVLLSGPVMPAQQARLMRLRAVLQALRESGETVCDAPPSRSKETR
jgi:hypothetical protein